MDDIFCDCAAALHVCFCTFGHLSVLVAVPDRRAAFTGNICSAGSQAGTGPRIP